MGCSVGPSTAELGWATLSRKQEIMVKSVLITGANGGLGKDAARQFALLEETEKVYLACRNPQRAAEAKASLEETTGRSIFDIVLMDVSDLGSVRSAVASLDQPVEALIMNAGGMGGKDPGAKTTDGVTQQFASNVLGHAVLLDELLAAKKLTKVALYVGSEAARGVPMMGMKRPELETSSVDDFVSIGDGSLWGDKFKGMEAYGPAKYAAAMWMSSMARQHPDVRMITMSPGGTVGTEVMNDLPPVMAFLFRHVAMRVLPLFGVFHKLEVGAKRFVDGVNDEAYETGRFYASKKNVSGEIVDQATLFDDLNNEQFQDNANEAIHQFTS